MSMEEKKRSTTIGGEPAEAKAEGKPGEREYPRRDVTIIGQPASAGAEALSPTDD